MLAHYRELFRQFRWTILGAAVVGGLGALAISMVLLRTMPIYESSVTLNMQPSAEDLQFNSAFLGVSQFNPATIIAQTHIERILSRPVMERAVDIVIEQSGGGGLSAPPDAFDRLRTDVFRWLRILNSGFFVPPTEIEAYINDLRGATSVEIVEGSYILLVTVSHTEPVIAARAANALAAAYVELAQTDLRNDAAEVDRSLDVIVDRNEALLSELMDERQAIGSALGVVDVAAERENLLAGRAAALEALQDARIDMAEARATISGLEDSVENESDGDLARQFRQALVTARASIATAEVRFAEREANLRAAQDALRELDAAQNTLADVEQRIASMEAELAELQQRRVRTDLAREARLSQVRTISEAQVPIYPTSPKVLFNTIVGFIVGAVLATVPILAMDVLGDRIRTSEDLRGGFSSRVLPPIRPKLVRSARRFLRRGGRPPRRLRRFAEQLGLLFATTGPRRWPDRAVHVTALGSTREVEDTEAVLRAAVGILDRRGADGARIEVEMLPPLPHIRDWGARAGQHVVIGIPPGEATRTEVRSVANALGDQPPATFAALMS
ncbi:hypothetical protein [Jannaschia sp. LMIT008]|uniref:GumC family protein n=1 Tax=Jannaschia maritima TaxID=3032585 RepID=UPI002810C6E7|nr:hypothetical protein [Jannaschia sp. LMIT008]